MTPEASTDRAGRATALRPVLLVLATAAAVTVAAKGTQVLLPAAELGTGWTWGVRLLGLACAAAGARWLLAERARIRAAEPRGPDPSIVGVRTAATLMVSVFVLSLLNPPPRGAASDSLGAFNPFRPSPFGSDHRGGSPPPHVPTRGGDNPITGNALDYEPELIDVLTVEAGESLLSRVRSFLPFLMFLIAALLLVRYLGARRKSRILEVTFELPGHRARAEAGLEASLHVAATYGPDPRSQITRAYHQLLTALGRSGAEREPQEAPHEHLRRALGALGVRPDPLHRLAGIYVLAQFGGRPVGEEHRAQAVDALEESLADLRARAEAHPARRGATLHGSARA